MKSELANKLKSTLDNMTQADFDQVWSKVTSMGYDGPNAIEFAESLEFSNDFAFSFQFNTDVAFTFNKDDKYKNAA
jgi:hypothetical protein